MGRTFSMASSKRYRILTKDNGVLTVKFASLDEANKYIKQNALKGAKAYKLGDIRFSESGEQRAYADARKDFMSMLKECGFLTVKDKDLLIDGFSPRDLYLKCPKKGFVGTWDAQDSFIITDNDFSNDKTLEIPLNLMTKKYQNFMYTDSPKYDSSVKAFEKKLKQFLGELGFHKPNRDQLRNGFDPDDMIMEFPKMGFMGTFGADHSFIITNDQREPRQIEKTIEFEYWELAKDKNISKMFSKTRSFSAGNNTIIIDKKRSFSDVNTKVVDKLYKLLLNSGFKKFTANDYRSWTGANEINGKDPLLLSYADDSAIIYSDDEQMGPSICIHSQEGDGIYIPIKELSKRTLSTFSIGDNIITVDKDPAILKNEDKNPGLQSALNASKPKDTIVNFDNGQPFFMSVEPFITAQVMSDTADGIYVGTIKGSEISAGSKIINMMVKLNEDYPYSVIAIIKGKQVYVWKAEDLVRKDAAKVFSIADKYIDSKNQTQHAVEDAVKEIEKNMTDVDSDESFIKACHNIAKAILKDKYDKDVTQNTAEGILRDQDGSYDKKLGIYKNGLRSFSAPQPTEYGFILDKDNLSYDMDHVIGTLLMSVSYAHLFHLIKSSYATHMALDEYYHKMPESVDQLAEAYLAETNVAKFACCVVPTNDDPIDYLTDIRNYLIEYPKQTAGELKSNFQSLLDDAVNIIEGTLYKLKRLQSGMKSFSDGTKTQRVYGSGKVYAVYHQHHPALGFIYGLADSDSEFIQNLPDEFVDGDDLSFNAAQALRAKLELRDKNKLGK